MKEELTLQTMMKLQRELHDKYQTTWDPLTSTYGRNSLLWLMGEVGEVIDIIKKKGDQAIEENPVVRAAFVKEMADVLMYFVDVLLRYQITYEEFENMYVEKHFHNLHRDYFTEAQEFLEKTEKNQE